MVRHDDLGAEIFDTALHKLYQLQMRHGVHLDIRKICRVAFGDPENGVGARLLLIEMGREIVPRGGMVCKRRDRDLVSLPDKLVDARA